MNAHVYQHRRARTDSSLLIADRLCIAVNYRAGMVEFGWSQHRHGRQTNRPNLGP